MRINCPYCKSERDVIKRGKRRNKYTVKQIYRCKNCRKYFIEHDGFEHMTYPKEIIVKVLHLFVEGLSLSKIRNFIYQHEGYYLYDGTILYWVKKYSKILERFERELKPTVKGKIHTDEVQVKVKGKKRYSVNSIDSKSKYNLAGSFMKRRTKTNCRNHFGKLYDKIGEQVKDRWKKERGKPKNKRNLVTFVSDKFENYKKGFNYYFYRFAKLIFGVPIACKKYGLEHNNNPSERHNEDIKQRYKVTRGFNSDEGAEAFLTLRRIIYNFVRPHQTLERTPAEEGDINLSLGRNKLLGLIKKFFHHLRRGILWASIFSYMNMKRRGRAFQDYFTISPSSNRGGAIKFAMGDEI